MLQHALVHFGASFHPKTKGEFNRIFKERVEFVLAADTQPAGPPLMMLPAANITFQGDFTVNTNVCHTCSPARRLSLLCTCPRPNTLTVITTTTATQRAASGHKSTEHSRLH